ncbi:MAG TPA: esterase-like activity of phytase family protein [Bacteroidia bacterium]|nr:esterase-like activity of phytase family protein [Bacteroidia bacterium]
MKRTLRTLSMSFGLLLLSPLSSNAQITLLQDYKNNVSAPIGTFQGLQFREAGFSALYAIPGTNGKEFWTCSDRGVNIDAANANPATCRPTYDKIYAFPGYAPKIHRIRVENGIVTILQTITMKRPDGTTATGIINPTGFGSTAAEVASTDTVLDCSNFNNKIAPKDVWGIDSEGLIVDKEGNFWICEEGGPTIWKLNQSGVVIKRFTPYASQPGAQSTDVQIDTVFKYRKNNRGFEGIAITPSGKIYAITQSPILYPTKAVGEGTQIHRILEINPADNSTRMFAYLNDGIIGTGADQIRLRDWKIGDMAAVNDNELLVLEAGLRGATDIKRLYKIDISTATPVHSGLYSGKTLEALTNLSGLTANSIVPVSKTLVMDLLANGWPSVLDKAEGLAIVNDSTIAICNDNDYGQSSPLENGIATATSNVSHVLTYRLSGSNKLSNYVSYHCANSGLAVNAGPDKSVYVGYTPQECAFLLANVQGGKFPYQLKWNTAATIGILNVCPTATTIYSVTVTDADGCIAKDSVTVCATDVRCGNNKVIVCGTQVTKNGTNQQTQCLPVAAAAVLINQHVPSVEWTLGACNTTSDCGSANTIARTALIDNAQMTGDLSINLYPNPTNNSSVTLELSNVSDAFINIRITDLLGKTITVENVAVANNSVKKQFEFENNLPKGVYIVSVATAETVITEKLIVQ